MRIGSGTRLKILEAMAMGKTVVSTSIGCEGLTVDDNKNIVIVDEPEKFAGKVLELFNNPDKKTKIGIAARKLVEEKYTWDAATKKLNEYIGRSA